MTEFDWIGIYKGLRLPVLAILLMAITAYVYWPSRKRDMEEAKFRMLDE